MTLQLERTLGDQAEDSSDRLTTVTPEGKERFAP